MHTAHWLRNLSLSKVQIQDLITTCHAPTISSELNELFVATYSTNRYHIEYSGFLSNHLSHGMLAMHQLNYPFTTIQNYMKWYTAKKHLEPSLEHIPIDTVHLTSEQWKDEYSKWRGSRTNFYEIYNLFECQLSNPSLYNNDLASFINDQFTLVSGGQCGALLHGLIHFGYGISCMNRQMILEGISYLEHSYLEFAYNPSDEILERHDGNMDIIEVLDLIRSDGTLRKCIYDHFDEVEHLKIGGIQPPLVLLSQYEQPLISQYVAMFRNTIPLLTVNFEENRNCYLNEIWRLKQYLLSLTVKLFAYSESLEYCDFVNLHLVTSAWSLCEILPYLKSIDDINRSVLEYLCVAVAVFVGQMEQDMSKGMGQEAKEYSDESADWRYLMAEIAYNLKEDALNEIFHDEHVYKLVAVVLECLENGMIDEKLAYLAIRKAAEQPLIIRGISRKIKEERQMNSQQR